MQQRFRWSAFWLRSMLRAQPDITFVRSYGNVGDELIYAGTRRLLKGIPHREVGIRDVPHLTGGGTAVFSGGGAWCQPFHEVVPEMLPQIEERFANVVVLPSSFDTSVPVVKQVLSRSRAWVFARERESYRQIRHLCRASLAHDCAFYFDYGPFRQKGCGTLYAFRTDRESTIERVPDANRDVSVVASSLDEWLWAISSHEKIITDRAHVMIAGAMMGKRVTYHCTAYHKVPAIARYSLSGFALSRRVRFGGDHVRGASIRPDDGAQ